jgi:hypothetical protein
MKLHRNGVVAVSAHVMAGRNVAITKPQALKIARRPPESGVQGEVYVVFLGGLIRDYRDAREAG